MFIVGHDEFSGRSRGNLRMLNLGLAAGLIAELAVDGFVGVTASTGAVWARHRDTTPTTGVTFDLLDFIRSEPKLPLADWMSFLARDDNARSQVGQRLLRAGIVTPRTERHRLRRQVVYPAAHTAVAQYTLTRLAGLGRASEAHAPTVSDDDVVLMALLVATDLSAHIAHETTGRLRVGADVVDTLPDHLRALVGHAGAALGSATLRGH